MKAVNIEFVAPTRWKAVWALAALLGLGVVADAAWTAKRAWEQQALAHQKKRVLEEEVARQSPKAPVPPPASPSAGARTAAKLLQTDLNPIFTAIEQLVEPGIRVRSLQIDVNQASVQLELELDSMARAFLVTANLNAGRSDRPWVLESTNAKQAESRPGLPLTGALVTGVWRGRLE